MDDSTGLLLTDLRKDDRPEVIATVVVVITPATGGAPDPFPEALRRFSEEATEQRKGLRVVVFLRLQH